MRAPLRVAGSLQPFPAIRMTGWDDVGANYEPAMERIRHRDYWIDTQLREIENR